MRENIYGIQAVKALLERDPQRCVEVVCLIWRDDRRLQRVIEELESQGIVIHV
ncbi:23S rRNA (guanosine(2251)-2'-O)-methyltransferase RlmB, partial [Pectobacterium brasiliense]|uniref:RNA methyltransferase substrate-binding domain-containing protein n=1 Tax=Pectobacterium brasiliense TaxID=180957 RepID=UPI0023DDEF58